MYPRVLKTVRALAIAVLMVFLIAVASQTSSAQQRLGTLKFENSGAPEAQEAFLTGVKLLHSFEFDDSAIAFREAQNLDPDFALA